MADRVAGTGAENLATELGKESRQNEQSTLKSKMAKGLLSQGIIRL